MAYLWLKTFHIVLITSWFAGLFYLPRIFVNLAMVPEGAANAAERDRLLLMANKLFRFMTPLGVLAVLLAWYSGSASESVMDRAGFMRNLCLSWD